MPAVPAQALVVGPDQVRLADRGGGLELPQVVGPALQAELADPGADGTRADQGHLPARVHHRADLLGQVVDSGRVERAVGAGQDARADLDDPDARGEHDLVADQIADGGIGRMRGRRRGPARTPPARPGLKICFGVQESSSRHGKIDAMKCGAMP